MFIKTLFGIGPPPRFEFWSSSSLELNQAINLDSRIPAAAGIKAFSLASLFTLEHGLFPFYFLFFFFNLLFAVSYTLEILL